MLKGPVTVMWPDSAAAVNRPSKSAGQHQKVSAVTCGAAKSRGVSEAAVTASLTPRSVAHFVMAWM